MATPRARAAAETNCSIARIRTRDSARSRGGSTLATVPPWQNRATARVRPSRGPALQGRARPRGRSRPVSGARRPRRRARSPSSPALSSARLTPVEPLRRSRARPTRRRIPLPSGTRTVRISHMRSRRVKKSHMPSLCPGPAARNRRAADAGEDHTRPVRRPRPAARPSSRCCRRASGPGTRGRRPPGPRARSRGRRAARSVSQPGDRRLELRPQVGVVERRGSRAGSAAWRPSSTGCAGRAGE